MKGYIIGNKDFTLGFRLIGIKGITVLNSDEALKILKEIVKKEGSTLIFISEKLSSQIQDELDEIRSQSDALIIEVPGKVVKESQTAQRLIAKALRVRV
ncbi:hypothetical protein DRO35_05330 [Candidatus Bathyarchaeota archaeon]|nr:MAG: hypothetical protein DRO35_05330 [Candidatus Bathyarchaeota archaeon]